MGELVGHPFDTVKVTLQTTSKNIKNIRMIPVFKEIWLRNGIRGLYKGLNELRLNSKG